MPKMPAALKKQQAKARKLQEELAAKAKKAKEEEPGTSATTEVIEPPPQAPAEPEPPAKPAQGEPTAPPQEDWQQKYLTLKGKYDAEVSADVPQLREQNAALQAQLQEATNTIATLNDIIANSPGNPDSSTPGGDEPSDGGGDIPAAEPLLDPADFEGYGQEMIAAVDNINRLAQENQALKQQLYKLQESTEKFVESRQADAISTFMEKLSMRVQDAVAINEDPRFIQWLQAPDDKVGIVRMELLQRWVAAGDVARTASMFNEWKQSVGMPATAPGAPQAPQPAVAPQAPAGNDLAGQAMPDTSATGTSAPEPIRLTADSLKQAAVDFSQGRIALKDYQEIAHAFQRQQKQPPEQQA